MGKIHLYNYTSVNSEPGGYKFCCHLSQLELVMLKFCKRFAKLFPNLNEKTGLDLDLDLWGAWGLGIFACRRI